MNRVFPPTFLLALRISRPGVAERPVLDLARLSLGAVRRDARAVRGSGRTGRPAWQSPYGPPPRRTHRGRWAPVPGTGEARPPLRRERLCGQCD